MVKRPVIYVGSTLGDPAVDSTLRGLVAERFGVPPSWVVVVECTLDMVPSRVESALSLFGDEVIVATWRDLSETLLARTRARGLT